MKDVMIFFKGILSKLRSTTERKTTEIMEPSEYEAKKAAYRACFVEDNGSWRVGNHWLDRYFTDCDVESAAEMLSRGDFIVRNESKLLYLHDYKTGEVVFLNSDIPNEHILITRKSFTTQLGKEFRKRYENK